MSQPKSQTHRAAKHIFYGDIIDHIPSKILKARYAHFLNLTEHAKTEWEKETARIVAKRYYDLLLTAWMIWDN